MFIQLYLLCFALLAVTSAQQPEAVKKFELAQIEFDNGNYSKAIEIGKVGLKTARKSNSDILVLKGLDLIASAQISMEKFSEAEATLSEAQSILQKKEITGYQKAQIYLRVAWLWRSQHKTGQAFEFGKKAFDSAPNDKHIQAEFYLNSGRILFSSGYDISGIIWLKKAEKILDSEKTTAAKLDTYRFLSLAWQTKSNFQTAISYTEKLVALSKGTQFKQKHRQGLYELGNLLSATGQINKAFSVFKEALDLSILEKNTYQARNLLSVLLFNCLNENKVEDAVGYLGQLEKLDTDNEYLFDISLGKAVIAAFEGRRSDSEFLFARLDKMENDNLFMIPLWQIPIAERQKDWDRLIGLNQTVLELTLKNNFRDDLPKLYFNFANAYFNLGQTQKCLENLEKSLSLVEEIRQSENSNLTLGVFETYHLAYRLLTQIKAVDTKAGFESADLLKARLLKDKIDKSPVRNSTIITEVMIKKLEEISLKFFDDQSYGNEIEKNERLITTIIPELNIKKRDFSELEKIPDLDNSAIISYFFTLDKKLLAFVWEKEKVVRTVEMPINEDNVERLAAQTHQNIKNRVFFKRDGKAIYDKLLKPLALTSKHLIIIPDKSLWKIPFQALSSDGEKYLTEERLISYAPSVSILADQLRNPKPNRQTLQAFANSTFENKFLAYANTESITVAEIYNSKPIINATIADFERMALRADVLHFSIHAQVDKEQPLDSFLGFRKFGKNDGRLTVEEILNIRLKKGSLVFLASCDTNNVLSGEGLVSLAWAMMGSGATTVISSGWEANDKSTAIFTNNFYRSYRQGTSAAESMQKASLELIKDKSGNMHEPYYWADFTLNGDFR